MLTAQTLGLSLPASSNGTHVGPRCPYGILIIAELKTRAGLSYCLLTYIGLLTWVLRTDLGRDSQAPLNLLVALYKWSTAITMGHNYLVELITSSWNFLAPFRPFTAQSSAFTSTLWTKDHKLLQESTLTAWQPRTLYISFDKRRLLANEGLVNLTGATHIRLWVVFTLVLLYLWYLLVSDFPVEVVLNFCAFLQTTILFEVLSI